MSEIIHPTDCSCGAHDDQALDPSRRAFIQRMGWLGAAFAGGAPLLGCSLGNDPAHRDELVKSTAIQGGKAQRFTILHTADIHAQLSTHDEFFHENGKAVYRKRGGFAVLKTMIDTLRAENPGNTLVIDGGDCFQGGGVAALSEGQAIVPLVNRIGYDLVLPGNWEVVYGKAMMMKDLNAYTAQKICANMFHDTQDANKGRLLFQPWWTKTIGGIKIGFIGYNDPLTPKRQSPAYSKGITFTRPEVNVAGHIRHLRDKEQCAMVFLVTHMGIAQQVDLANKPEVEGVDFILGADTHERVRTPIQATYAKVTEPGAFGSFISRLDIVVEDGRVKYTHYELLDVDPEKYPADAGMLALVEEVRAPFKEELDRVVGTTRNTLVRYYVIENPMDNLVTDALMWKLKPDIAVSNGFRFCPPIVVEDPDKPVPITNDHLWSMIPVDSDAKYGSATGQQILDWLEKELNNVFAKDPADRFGGWMVRFQGMRMVFIMHNDRGRRVVRVDIGGKPLERDKVYRIAACERDGDPDDMLCRMEKVGKPELAGVTMHTILREYLAEFSPVAPKVEGRITATDAPADLLSQLEGYDYTF
ncbi:MAG TPA: bifunctional metallophosphatase/5'-nucleotidase, partial [Flavobacteriales bacterium]|nr:bifunctional metallophosphatase/5'-nucleotidase [Flavobacteriales bacterium]